MKKTFNITAFIFLLIFLIIASGVMTGSRWVEKIDLSLISLLQANVTETGASVIAILTNVGGVEEIIIFTLAAVIILFIRKMYVAGFWFGLTVFVSPGVLVSIIKLIVDRDRPDFLRLAFESSQSFPSGHSTASTVFYGLIAVSLILLIHTLWKRVLIGILALALISFVMASRIYLGVHFPTDVLAGFSFGTASVLFSLVLYQSVRTKFQAWLSSKNIQDKSPSLFQ